MANYTLTIEFYIYIIFLTFPKALTKNSPPIEPGLLTVETVSWKSLKPRDLVVTIHTYATKATVVRLPVGYGVTLFFPILRII